MKLSKTLSVVFLSALCVLAIGCKGDNNGSSPETGQANSPVTPPGNQPANPPSQPPTQPPTNPPTNPPTQPPTQPPKSPSEPLALNFTGVRPSATTNVSVSETFQLSFDRPLDSSIQLTVNTGLAIDDVSLHAETPNGEEIAEIQVSISGSSLVVNPVYDLLNNQDYILRVAAGLRSVIPQDSEEPAFLEEAVEIRFRTADHGGANPGDLVILHIEDSGNANYQPEDPEDYIDKFVASYGQYSRSHPEFGWRGFERMNVELEESPTLYRGYTGSRNFTAYLTASFQRGATYYFSVQTCTFKNVCSPYADDEAVRSF